MDLFTSALAGIAVLLGINVLLIYLLLSSKGERYGYLKILPSVILTIDLFLAFNIVGGIVLILFNGLNVKDAPPLSQLAANGIGQLSMMFFGAVLVTRLRNQNPYAVFRLEGVTETPTPIYLLAVPMMLGAQIVGTALSSIWIKVLQFIPSIYEPLQRLEDAIDKSQTDLVTTHSMPELLLMVILVGLVPAIAEETLFRGFLQTNIERSGKNRARPYLALILSSILFAAVHGSAFKFPGLLCLGLTLGWISYRTNNLLVGSFGHAFNNGMIVIALYASPKLLESSQGASDLVGSAQYSVGDSLMILTIGLSVCALFFFLFYRLTEPLRARYNADIEIAHHRLSHYSSGGDSFEDPNLSHPKHDETLDNTL